MVQISSSSSSSSYLRLINFVKTQSNTINEVSGVNSTHNRHDNDCRETASTCGKGYGKGLTSTFQCCYYRVITSL